MTPAGAARTSGADTAITLKTILSKFKNDRSLV